VFNSLYAARYDLVYAGKNYTEECDLIEAAASRYCARRPATLLDVGCGTGQHSLELQRRGFRVTGVDLSDHMLQQARAKSVELPEDRRPAWIRGDARTFDAGDKFDMVIMMFAVIGYLTTNDDVVAGLHNIRRHLKQDAIFACDFWYGPAVLTERPTERVRVLQTPNGEVIRSTSTVLDIVKHTADVTFRLWAIENRKVVSEATETHRLRYFFPQEFALLLSQSGFSLLNISAFPFIDAPLTDRTWNAFVIARAV
jgi:SAM-dependent methyltransferase